MATATNPKKRNPSIPELVSELKELVVTYVKQETVEPIKGLGRFIGFGVAGSVLVAMSGVFLTLGLVRLLQEETGDAFDGNLSFVPYVGATVAAAIAAFLAVRAIGRGNKAKGR